MDFRAGVPAAATESDEARAAKESAISDTGERCGRWTLICKEHCQQAIFVTLIMF